MLGWEKKCRVVRVNLLKAEVIFSYYCLNVLLLAFVANVFLRQNGAQINDVQKCADEGIYLNQMLVALFF